MWIRFKSPQSHPIIGDDCNRAFLEWRHAQDKYGSVDLVDDFVEWLVTTYPGALALQRIVDWPKQETLKFEDTARPWEITGYAEEAQSNGH